MSILRNSSILAAGAVLASALTFTGLQPWQASAAPGDTDTTFVPVPPCRLFDTRTGSDNVGVRSTPLGAGDTFTTQVTGSNGDCIAIPNDATAIAFNATAVNPRADSFLTFFPADQKTRPTASNLNVVANQAPVPNKVDVKLSPDGKVKIYNHAGTVDVIADIVGYYTPSSLATLATELTTLQTQAAAGQQQITDLTASVTSLTATVASLTATVTDLNASKATVTRDESAPSGAFVGLAPTTIREISLTPTVDGTAVVSVFGTTAGGTETGECAILTAAGASPVGAENSVGWNFSGEIVATLRVIPVLAGQNTKIFFVCAGGTGGTTTISSPDLFAVVVPD